MGFCQNAGGEAHTISAVFADAGELQAAHCDKVVHLTDTEVERAVTVRTFIQLSSKWLLPKNYDMKQLINLAKFLDKYRCTGPITVVCESLRRRINSSNYIHIFGAASHLGDKDLAAHVYRAMINVTYEDEGEQYDDEHGDDDDDYVDDDDDDFVEAHLAQERCYVNYQTLTKMLDRWAWPGSQELSDEYHWVVFRALINMASKLDYPEGWRVLLCELVSHCLPLPSEEV